MQTRIYLKLFTCMVATMTIVCCGDKDKSKTEEAEKSVQTTLLTEVVEVTTEPLQTIDFEHELVSNGRISAQQVAELQFVASGNIPTKVFVKNGDRVKAGDAIAMLDTFILSNSYRQASDNLKKADLDLQELLLGRYLNSDPASIPKEELELAHIRSGYNNAKNQYELAKYNLENATLRTPIAGIVANLFSKPYNPIDGSKPFCTIISENMPEVDFTILENELPLLKIGDKVKIQPYASPGVEAIGSVVNINPSVDKEGTVRVKAFIQPDSRIFNGMNVRVSVFRSLGKHWVVPKTAVVYRTNKQVVFIYKNGKAAWNYVDTEFENSTHYSITSKTLQEGDAVIISGNEHLAEGTNVKLIED